MVKLIVFLLLASSNAWALDYRETLKAKVTHLYPSEKRIIISRGIEDGVLPNDTAKFVQNEKALFSGKAIAVSKGQSEWAIYYAYGPALLEKESEIELKSLNNYFDIAKIDLPHEGDSKLKKMKQAEFVKSRAEQIKAERERIAKLHESNLKSQVDSLKIPPFHLGVSFSPLTYSSYSGEENILYGIVVKSRSETEDLYHSGYELRFNDSRRELVDPFVQTRIKSTEQSLSHQWFKEEFFGKAVDYTTWFSWKTHAVGPYNPIKNEIRVGPIGFKNRSKVFKSGELTTMFVPQYETASFDKRVDGTTKTSEHRVLRASFYINGKYDLTEKVKLDHLFVIRPAYDLDKSQDDFTNADIFNRLGFSYLASKHFSATYANEFISDKRKSRYSNLPITEKRHILSMNLDMDLF